MYAHVLNEPSFEAVQKLGLLTRIPKTGDLKLIGPFEVFNQIPIARVLIKGGIEVTSIELEGETPEMPAPHDLWELYSFRIRGRIF